MNNAHEWLRVAVIVIILSVAKVLEVLVRNIKFVALFVVLIVIGLVGLNYYYTGSAFGSNDLDDIMSEIGADTTAGVVGVASRRGIRVEPENRCTPYKRSDYYYSPSVEEKIVNRMGKIYSPYTNECFASTTETDIEHIVSLSEAHDSGMCEATRAEKRAFANDLGNLTLASPSLNRHQKSDKDAGEWLPDENKCWYTFRVLKIKEKYGLSVDKEEIKAIAKARKNCPSNKREPFDCPTIPIPQTPDQDDVVVPDPTIESALDLYDDNGNGRITCSEARAHGIAPVTRDHPAYIYMDDRNKDGVVC